jgi:transcriptional regulator with XRE-family HTH domain
MPPPALRYCLLDRDLLRRLMKRTGNGTEVTIRELAREAGCSASLVGHLLTGESQDVSVEIAHGISEAIGVDVLILFTPTGRRARTRRHQEVPECPTPTP